MQRKLWVATIIFLASLLLIPVATSAGSVNVVDENDFLEQESMAGAQVQWSWYIYNNISSPVHVQAHLTISQGAENLEASGINLGGQDSAVAQIDPGEGLDAILTMDVSRLSSSGIVQATVTLTVTNLSNVSIPEIHTMDVTLHITSLYSGEDSYNRIMGIYANPLPAPLDGPVGALAATLLIYAAIGLILYAVILPFLLRRELSSKTAFYNETLKILRIPTLLLVMVFGIVQCFSIFGTKEATLITVNSVANMLYIILGARIGWALYKIVARHLLVRFGSTGLVNDDLSLLPLLNWIGIMFISLGALSGVLSVLGFDIMVILTGAGILGLAISLGAQDTLKTFFAGLSLLIERPFKVGDLLQMEDGIVVEVVKVGLRSTTFFNTFDPQYFIIPNDVVANSKIVNVLRPDPRYKAKVEVGVAYGSDIALVKKAMLEAAMEHPEVLKTPDEMPLVRFMGFGDSSLNFRLFTWVPDFNDHYRILSELREAIDAKFRTYGIEIPFPQRDLWIREKKENDE